MMFADRSTAGRELAKRLSGYKESDVVVLGIPRGGVAVALPVARELNASLDILITRKLPIPWSPEVSFGAVSSSGEILLNDELIDKIRLTKAEIKEITSRVLQEIRRRECVYRKKRVFPDLEGKVVILVDDGLASGYTMVAAIKSVCDYNPSRIVVAVPVAPKSAAEKIGPLVDEVVSIHLAESGGFAVASFYEDFCDLEDGDVVGLLEARWSEEIDWDL